MKYRNIILLAIAQAIGNSGLSMITLLGGIIGAAIAPTPALATLPASLTIGGMAFFTLPASVLMRRFGRKAGFMLGSSFVMAAGLLAAYALSQQSFVLFCAATLLVGANTAFVQQYRFAAIESVNKQWVGRAVSIVLVGGIASGFIGPEMARRAQDLLPVKYAGSFIGLSVLSVVAASVLFWLQSTAQRDTSAAGSERPLRAIVSQPMFRAAVLAGAVGYAVMSFIMTATPVYLHSAHYSLDETATVIQSHIVAMFLPSLFTGFLIDRFGLLRVMSAGVLCLGVTVVLAVGDRQYIHYWGALVLLGIGWNFLFVGATVLLPRSYSPAERFKAQAANDFTIFAVQGVASFSSGTVLALADWNILNLSTLPFLAIALWTIFTLRHDLKLALQPAR
ncbi:MAG: MFS transporter [Chloroflexi bacterium]|nr:MFS transporter [Chloroflexota bacterium]